MRNRRVSFIAKVAIFTTISAVLYAYIKFPLAGLFPPFLELNITNLPAIIGGFALGPVGGILIVIFRTLLKLLLVGSSSMYIGEFVDVLIGILVVGGTSLFYSFHKTKKGGVYALILAFFVWIASALLFNAVIAIPLYIKSGMITAEGLVNMCKALPLMKGITLDNYLSYYILGACLPFNAIIALTVCLVTLLVYKKISVLLTKMDASEDNK